MVVVVRAETPSNEEVQPYIAALEPYVSATSAPRVLVVTEGGSPRPAERKQLDRIAEPHKSRIKFAIVTESTVARGVLVAIRVIYPFYQGFSPNDIQGALRFLDVPSGDTAEVLQAVNELRAELGLPPMKA